jgi:endonuclease G
MEDAPATRDDVHPYRRLVRPLHIGLSVGHPSGTCGSIGAFVRNAEGAVGFLSTANVLAPGKARPGDFIHQPSAMDFDLTGASRAGELSAHIARPETGDVSDVAVAWLLETPKGPLNVVPPGLPNAGDEIGLTGKPIRPGDLVAMTARTTGYNHGAVEAVDATVTVRIGPEKVEFQGCIAVRSPHGPFTRPGDAGALVWRLADRMAAGIVFAAGNSEREDSPITFVLPLAPILDRFGLSLA